MDNKTYLDGKLKLKDPFTLGDMIEVAKLIKSDINDVMVGEGLIKTLVLVTEGLTEEEIKKIDANLATEILKDFFIIAKPIAWINTNLAILTEPKNSSSISQKESKDIKKP